MTQSNQKLIGGVAAIILGGATLLMDSIPIIWIGGFLLGASLIGQGLSLRRRGKIYQTNSELKEIISCSNCKQRLRVPVDRWKYKIIRCPTCKHSPFTTSSYPFLTRLLVNRFRLLIFFSIFGAVIIIFYIFYEYSRSNSAQKTLNTSNPGTQINFQFSSLATSSSPTTPILDQLPNGTVIKRNLTHLQGNGTLSIHNGTASDAIAKLVINNQSVFTVYLRSNSSYIIPDISDGVYKLIFALGNNWDPNAKTFTTNMRSEKFEDYFSFLTREVADGYYYTGFSVTLNPIFGGTAKTDSITQSEFNNY